MLLMDNRLLIVTLIFTLVLSQSCSHSPNASNAPSFQKGMAFPTWVSEQYCTLGSDESLMNLAQNTCTEWVQFVPSWYQKDKLVNEMSPEYDVMTAKNECLRQAIQKAHSLDLKVMLKPHVDALNGDWRGTFQPSDSTKWFENYQKMITAYAELAEEEGVEILSIGCEFVELTKPEFTAEWREVIKAVQKFYQGPLVYSANWWQEYPQVEFWGDLDYIGIDAYFPLTNETEPTLDELLAGWALYLPEIEAFYDSWKIPIIFTEIGYRSIDGANIRPWDWETPGVIDLEEQALCYQAVITTLEAKPWFEGIYWWNWEPDPHRGGLTDKGFTPHGKPAEEILKRWYCEMINKKKGQERR